MLRLIAVITLWFLSSCATYQNKVSPAKTALNQNECETALKLLEPLALKESDDQLAFLLEYASALQTCEQYKKSTEFFQKADKLSEQIDYTSITRSATSTFISEGLSIYKGDTFEKFFINIANALNYLALNELDDATVEIRRLNQKYSALKNEDKKNFELNSFAKYLSGLIWEAQKEFDDACISYQDSYKLDSSYKLVEIDMLKACWKAKRYDEFDRLAKKTSLTADALKEIKSKNSSDSELIIIIQNGWGPQKQPRPNDHRFPYLVRTPSNVEKFKFYLSGMTPLKDATSSVVYNVDQVAIKTLNDDYGRLVAKRVAAEAGRLVLLNQVGRQGSRDQDLLALAGFIALSASDRADLRQWSFLPKNIQTLRIPLSSGTYSAHLDPIDNFGQPLAGQNFSNLVIKKGINFLVVRSLK